MKTTPLVALALLTLGSVACDKTESPGTGAPSAAPSASAAAPAPAPPPPPAPSVPPEPAPSAAPAEPTKDTVVSVLDPTTEHARTVKARSDGSVALYLPEWPGTLWKVVQADAALGKPKEETIPGFAGPTTPAHAFTWKLKPGLKGETKKVSLSNGTKGKPPGPSFALQIDVQ